MQYSIILKHRSGFDLGRRAASYFSNILIDSNFFTFSQEWLMRNSATTLYSLCMDKVFKGPIKYKSIFMLVFGKESLLYVKPIVGKQCKNVFLTVMSANN